MITCAPCPRSAHAAYHSGVTVTPGHDFPAFLCWSYARHAMLLLWLDFPPACSPATCFCAVHLHGGGGRVHVQLRAARVQQHHPERGLHRPASGHHGEGAVGAGEAGAGWRRAAMAAAELCGLHLGDGCLPVVWPTIPSALTQPISAHRDCPPPLPPKVVSLSVSSLTGCLRFGV